jgi:hypothetical protein
MANGSSSFRDPDLGVVITLAMDRDGEDDQNSISSFCAPKQETELDLFQ